MERFCRADGNYDMSQVSDETGLRCEDDSRTKQSFAEESDINFIVNRFMKTGEMPGNFAIPQHGDFTGLPNFHEAMSLVVDAQAQFASLPASIRSRFGNSPGKLLDFLSDEVNRDEAVRLGLVSAPAAEGATSAPVAASVVKS